MDTKIVDFSCIIYNWENLEKVAEKLRAQIEPVSTVFTRRSRYT